RHFLREELVYLLRCWRLRELSDSQDFCCRDYWKIALRHFLCVDRLVLNVIHIRLLSDLFEGFVVCAKILRHRLQRGIAFEFAVHKLNCCSFLINRLAIEGTKTIRTLSR